MLANRWKNAAGFIIPTPTIRKQEASNSNLAVGCYTSFLVPSIFTVPAPQPIFAPLQFSSRILLVHIGCHGCLHFTMFLELKCFIRRPPSFECVCIARCLRKAIHSEMMAAVIDACKMLGACRASARTYNLKHVVVSSLHQRRVLISSGRESDGVRDKMPAVKLTIKPAYPGFLGSVHVTSGIQQMGQTTAGWRFKPF